MFPFKHPLKNWISQLAMADCERRSRDGDFTKEEFVRFSQPNIPMGGGPYAFENEPGADHELGVGRPLDPQRIVGGRV